MKRVLIVFPTGWDIRQLECCRSAWSDRYEVLFAGPEDEHCRWDFDVLGFIDEMVERWAGRIDGVLSSSDYPGATVAGAIATRLGLPGSTPGTLIRCSHKHCSRLSQQRSVPEAAAAFWPIRADDTGSLDQVRFPCFVKPVKGAYSVLARRIDDRRELREFLAQPTVREYTSGYLDIFNRLVATFTDLDIDGRWFIAEELLHGDQYTVEGFSFGGEVEIFGVTDSIMHPGTGSFARFEHPSRRPPAVQERMAGIARRAIEGLGLRDGLFNIEMMHDPASDRISIVEVNPRICGQFADLYQKVDGMNTYELALAVATGERPVVRHRAGRWSVAASCPLRTFEPVRVARVPDEAKRRAVEELVDETIVWLECDAGDELTDFVSEDGASIRYAIVNLGAARREELEGNLRRVQDALGIELEEMAGAGEAR